MADILTNNRKVKKMFDDDLTFDSYDRIIKRKQPKTKFIKGKPKTNTNERERQKEEESLHA